MPAASTKTKRWAKPLTHADAAMIKRRKVFAAVSTVTKKTKAGKKKSGIKKKTVAASATARKSKIKDSLPKRKPKKTAAEAPATAKKAKKKLNKVAAEAPKGKGRKSEVYVLQLEGGFVYVGKTSRGIKTRLAQHMGTSSAARFKGAAFTRLYRPTGKLLKRLGNLEGDGDGPERDETLRQMYKRGVHKVRGWKYVRAGLFRREELEDIESNIRELFDLCRKCGRAGHFASSCREAKDRHGRALRAAVVVAS